MNVRPGTTEFVPFNLELEQAVLGAVLMDNGALFGIADIIEPEMFFEGFHRDLWSLMVEKITAGSAVTPLTIAAALGKDAAVDIGGMTLAKYIARLAAESTSTLLAPDYAKTIRDLWMRRKLIALASDLQTRALGGFDGLSVEAMLDEADHELASIRFGKQADGVRSVGDYAANSLKETADAYQRDAVIGFDTGIQPIDNRIGPILAGDLVTIIGPSGGGKSALAAQILCRNTEGSLDTNRGAPGLFISLEMSGAQVARRVLATHTGIATLAQKSGSVNQAEYERLADAAGHLKRLPLYIDQSRRQTTSRIIRKLRAMKRQHGVTLAVVDHAKLIRPEHSRMSDMETIKHAAMEFKDAAGELGMAIILLAQVTRESMKRESLRVRSHDMFGGEILKECSDIVMTVSLPSKLLREREPSHSDRNRPQWEADCDRWAGKAEIGLPKIRDGEDGYYETVEFDGARARFGDAA